MDLKQIIKGQEYVVCCPDSWYLADKIKLENEQNDRYDIEYDKVGTSAKLKLFYKKKIVDFYDKEHVTYVRNNTPPKQLGALYWLADDLERVVFKAAAEEENNTLYLHLEDYFCIPYEVFKHLRDFDIVEIHTKNPCAVYRARKDWILKQGFEVEVKLEHGSELKYPCIPCVIRKTVFTKYQTRNKTGRA